jgi:hypothetical protein
MGKHVSGLAAVIGGLGILGIIAVLTFLFGDNIVGRAYDSLVSGGQPAESPPSAEPLPVRVEPEQRPPVPEPSEKTGSELLESLCGAGRMTLTFPVKDKDAPRYKRRAGTQIVAVPTCLKEDGIFRTRVESESTYDREGIVAGNRLQFQYRYLDAQGLVDCRVVAERKESRIGGSISCETPSDEAMDARKVRVEIAEG